jgi:hypothetical protein
LAVLRFPDESAPTAAPIELRAISLDESHQRTGPAMPLAHLPHPPRSGKPQDPPLRRTQGRGRHVAGAVALLVGLIGSGAGMATAAGAAPPAAPQAPAPQAPAPHAPAPAAPPALPQGAEPDFGPNVRIFDPSMPVAEIQATVDSIAAEQVDDEMGSKRYSLLFKPGTYGSAEEPLIVQVGYSTP